jgi:hypothetical protein
VTLVWLVTWLIEGHPHVTVSPSLSAWALALVLCAIGDISASAS